MKKKFEIVYRCEFELMNYEKLRLQAYSNKGIEDFIHGFWVDDSHRLTKGSDAKYWIPPSRIIYISKDCRTVS